MAAKRTPPDWTEGRPRRRKKSRAGWIAALFAVALVGWMGSGYLHERSGTAAEAPRERAREPMAVEVQLSQAEPITEFVVSEGQVAPARQTPVRAQVGGTVEAIEAQKGSFVEEGELIARLSLADRAAQLAQAEAELARRRRDFDSVSRLAEQGFATSARLEETRSALAAAKAALAQIRETAGNTEIRAPISGILDRLDIDPGEFVSPGDEIGTQVDIDPLVVEVQIPQQSIGRIERGQRAQASFITGQTREGVVRYIAANASAETRTFPVEVEVPNPGREIPAGISAQLRIPVGQTPAHFVSAALLALGSDGTLGIKAVNAQNVVEFYPIELVRAETDGIWIAGLPQELSIISVGQGFVSEGETVRVIEAAPGGTPQADPALVSQLPAPPPGEAGQADGQAAEEEIETAALAPSRLQPPQEAAQAGSQPSPLETLSVRTLQQRLQALGYDPGPVDGVLGEGTRAAIRQFQEDKGLDVTGAVDATLAAALLQTPTGGR